MVWKHPEFELLYNEDCGIEKRILYVNGFKNEGEKCYNLVSNPYIKYFNVSLNNVSKYLMLQIHWVNFMYGITDQETLLEAEMSYLDIAGGSEPDYEELTGRFPDQYEYSVLQHTTAYPTLCFNQIYSNVVGTY